MGESANGPTKRLSSERHLGAGDARDHPSQSPVDRELRHAVSELQLPMAIVNLRDFTVCLVSRAALKHLGLPASSVVGHPVLELFGGQDRADATAALKAMRAGVIDFYRAHRRLRATERPGDPVTEWVRAIQFGDNSVALVEAAFGSELRRSPLAEYLGSEPQVMALGTMDSSWVVTSLSSDVTTLLGVTPEATVGRHLLGAVEEHDVRRLLDADRGARGEFSVGLRVCLRDASGVWKRLRCVLTSLGGSSGRCFILLPDSELGVDGGPDRASQLEQHLLRIAGEVEASGILQRIGNVPDLVRFPQMRALTSRQWEVLNRLIRGERVPTIAAEMFVSQSTIRNHLAGVFERFGVHSQVELLALLARRDNSPS